MQTSLTPRRPRRAMPSIVLASLAAGAVLAACGITDCP